MAAACASSRYGWVHIVPATSKSSSRTCPTELGRYEPEQLKRSYKSGVNSVSHTTMKTDSYENELKPRIPVTPHDLETVF